MQQIIRQNLAIVYTLGREYSWPEDKVSCPELELASGPARAALAQLIQDLPCSHERVSGEDFDIQIYEYADTDLCDHLHEGKVCAAVNVSTEGRAFPPEHQAELARAVLDKLQEFGHEKNVEVQPVRLEVYTVYQSSSVEFFPFPD